MNFLKKIKKIIHIFFKRFFSFGSDADKDWKLVLILFFVFSFGAIIVGIFDFFHFSKFDFENNEKPVRFEFIDRGAIKSLLDKYDQRALDFEKIKLGQEL